MKKVSQPNIANKRRNNLQLPVITVYVFTITSFMIVLFIFSKISIKIQGDLLYQEKIQAVKIGLNHFANNAAVPLLDDDVLSLNVMMKEAKAIDGALYVAVIDNVGKVRAHTDISKIGSTFGKFEKGDQRETQDNTDIVTYPLPNGTQVLDLSRPVNFMKNQLGTVHVGLSLPFINGEVKKEMHESIQALVLLGLVLFGIMLCSALALHFWLKRVLSGQKKEHEQLYGSEAATIHSYGAGNNTKKCNIVDSSGSSMPEMNRNHVTVLFAGIKGFKAYAEINDRRKLMDDLSDYLALATDCIQTYGGNIDTFVGDSVIAVFDNSPHEADHAERALNAAVAMQKALQDSGRNGNPLLLKVGIGINSGVVLSGCVGSPAKKKNTFIGESFKVAYSMNIMAGPGEIIISRDAYRLLEHRIIVEPLPPLEMMQRTQSWENFRLLKINDLKDHSNNYAHESSM